MRGDGWRHGGGLRRCVLLLPLRGGERGGADDDASSGGDLPEGDAGSESQAEDAQAGEAVGEQGQR